jgi:hypothetical protein
MSGRVSMIFADGIVGRRNICSTNCAARSARPARERGDVGATLPDLLAEWGGRRERRRHATATCDATIARCCDRTRRRRPAGRHWQHDCERLDRVLLGHLALPWPGDPPTPLDASKSSRTVVQEGAVAAPRATEGPVTSTGRAVPSPPMSTRPRADVARAASHSGARRPGPPSGTAFQPRHPCSIVGTDCSILLCPRTRGSQCPPTPKGSLVDTCGSQPGGSRSLTSC